MGKRRRSFSEPKYEINLESKDKVLIRQEKKDPIWYFAKKVLTITAITFLTILITGIIYNISRYILAPSKMAITLVHGNGIPLSVEEYDGIKIHMNGRTKSMATKITPDGLALPFNKRGQHIIGIENTNSHTDSLAFVKEKELLDSLDFFGRKRYSQYDLRGFAFHKIISDAQFEQTRFLYFINREPRSQKPVVIFVSPKSQPAIMFKRTCAGQGMSKDATLLKDFQGVLFAQTSMLCPSVTQITNNSLGLAEHSYTNELPHFEELAWYSENRSSHYHYADEMCNMLRSAIFILPHIYEDENGKTFADFVLSFADVGEMSFDALEVRKIQLNEHHILATESVPFEIIRAYLRIYEAFMISGMLDESALDAFIHTCNRTPRTVDSLVRIDNSIVRFNASPEASIVHTLDDFFVQVEKLQCQALYDQLAGFWKTDPYNIRSVDQFNVQEKQVVRAIIKWTLALKENEHQCAEDKWPSAQQRLALFTAAKETIDETASLAWLQTDVLYRVLSAEINNLEEKQ